MREELKQYTILKRENPWSERDELEVAGESSDLAAEFTLDFLWPFVDHNRFRVDNTSVALADDGERLKHVIENDARRLRCREPPAHGVEAARHADNGIDDSLAISQPLLIKPVGPTDRG